MLKCEHRFCLNCLAACFLSGKNEEESQCAACKINTLKADFSPSSDLQTLLCLLKIQCNTWPPSSLLVIAIDATLHVLKMKMNLNPGKSLIEFISLLLSWPNKMASSP